MQTVIRRKPRLLCNCHLLQSEKRFRQERVATNHQSEAFKLIFQNNYKEKLFSNKNRISVSCKCVVARNPGGSAMSCLLFVALSPNAIEQWKVPFLQLRRQTRAASRKESQLLSLASQMTDRVAPTSLPCAPIALLTSLHLNIRLTLIALNCTLKCTI